MILGIARTLGSWFRPAIDAIFTRHLPFGLRWRLLALQPISLITYSIGTCRGFYFRPFDVEYIPIAPGRKIRVLVFKSPSPTGREDKLRPLHVDVHGGAFTGGLPESDAEFCSRVARETGAVVVSTSYRYAPRHKFPAAVDDVEALMVYLRQHATERYGADPSFMSVSGFSAGANLALAASLSAPIPAKAAVTFYGVVELRLRPEEKPAPADFPTSDPFRFLLPLWDGYASAARAANMENPRLSPILGRIEDLPENILMVIPALDILVHEQTTFIERLRQEAAASPEHEGQRFETMFDPKGFHGYLELPNSAVPQERKDWAFDGGVKFIQDAYRRHGWIWRR